MTVIRIANSNDLDQLVGLVEQYRAFYKQDSNVKTKEFLTDRFTNNEAVIFVAELNNQLVGFTLCYPSFSTVSLSRVWLLNDLFVDPTYRGQHIADQLMQTAESAAKSAGASRIWLRTAHTNTPAQGLYEGRGWKQDEVFRRYDLIF